MQDGKDESCVCGFCEVNLGMTPPPEAKLRKRMSFGNGMAVSVPSPTSSNSSTSLPSTSIGKKRNASDDGAHDARNDADGATYSGRGRPAKKQCSPQKEIFRPLPPCPAAQGAPPPDKCEDYGRVINIDWNMFPTYEVVKRSPHTCTPECRFHDTQRGMVEYMKVISSPLILPMLFGWLRCPPLGRGSSPSKRARNGLSSEYFYHYMSPCGKRIDTEKKLMDYLTNTQSVLPPSCFSFDEQIDPTRKLVVLKSKVQKYEEDLSKDVGDVRIPLVNCFDESVPENFAYVKKTSKTEKAQELLDKLGVKERKTGCGCRPDGICGRDCLCRMMMENDLGYVAGRLVHKQTCVVECNEFCGCGPRCGNRASTATIPFPLLLYYFPGKEWGVRAICDIPCGTFMGFYHGQIMCDEDISDAHDKFLVALDFATKNRPPNQTPGSDEVEFNVDGRRFGNVSRFFNHSCDPNLFAQPVHKESYDERIYNIGFFTKRNVKAGEELCWDYMYQIDSVPGRKIDCHCGAPNCKGRLL